MSKRRRQSGVAIVEFSLAGIGTIFLLICTFHLSMGMWNYHVIANAVHEATRYLSVKGVNCTKPGNSCTVTVGTIAAKLETLAVGIPNNAINVTLTSDSGAVTTCAPLSTCEGSTTLWPPHSNTDNAVGKKITVAASYRFQSPLLFFWPGAGKTEFGTIWFPASSTQLILF
jgi:Flp pilus assembly protein TadG